MKITVRTRQQSYTVNCEQGERILYAALRNGVPVPYECATGTCGTCKARAKPGDVNGEWAAAPGNSYLKPQRGEFLMCQSTACTDCEILVPGQPAPQAVAAAPPDYLSGSVQAPRMLTHDVAAFEMQLASEVEFHAGQFMVLRAPGLAGYRAYSMVNYAARSDRLSFVVKRLRGGGFSDWLFDGEPEQQTLQAFGPLGRATYDPAETKNLICVAGGSGIAGIMSILEHASAAGHFKRHRGHVFFGVRSMRDLFYLQELSGHVAAAGGKLRVTMALSDEDVDAQTARENPQLEFATGMVHIVAAERMAGNYDNTVAFVAGPPPMVDGALRVLIVEGRMPASDIRYDKFG